eukprot:10915752-Alexandrium_andersonii.AAC.1
MCIRDRRRAHPSGASGINFEAVPGQAQLKLRTPEAIVHVRQFRLRAQIRKSRSRQEPQGRTRPKCQPGPPWLSLRQSALASSETKLLECGGQLGMPFKFRNHHSVASPAFYTSGATLAEGCPKSAGSMGVSLLHGALGHKSPESVETRGATEEVSTESPGLFSMRVLAEACAPSD